MPSAKSGAAPACRSASAASLLVVAAASAYSVYTFWQVDPLGWFKGQKASTSPTPSSGVTTATNTPSPTATASPTPAVTATPGSSSTANSRDTQRQADLEAYKTAYAATRSGQYMPTQPQSVNVHRADPTTNSEYAIITSGNPSSLGQIYYKAGGRCTAASITPGSSGTRYVALLMKLETQSDPVCVDVP